MLRVASFFIFFPGAIYTNECFMSHVWTRCFTRTNAWFDTYRFARMNSFDRYPLTRIWNVCDIWHRSCISHECVHWHVLLNTHVRVIRHVTYTNTHTHWFTGTYELVMAHVSTSHVIHMNSIRIGRVTFTNTHLHWVTGTYESATTRVWTSHIIYMNAPFDMNASFHTNATFDTYRFTHMNVLFDKHASINIYVSSGMNVSFNTYHLTHMNASIGMNASSVPHPGPASTAWQSEPSVTHHKVFFRSPFFLILSNFEHQKMSLYHQHSLCEFRCA